MARQPKPDPQAPNPVRSIPQLMAGLASGLGTMNTKLDGVYIYRETRSSPRGPLVYRPGIIFVGQGSKNVFWGRQKVTYDSQNYLVLSVPLPVECEFQCSQAEPLLALFIEVTPALVGEVLLDMDESLPADETTPRTLHSNPMNPRITDALSRLLEALHSPRDSKVLGRQIVREIVYLVLTGEKGSALGLLASRADRFDQLARVLRELHSEPSRDYTIESLARKAHMSTSAFHSAFKQLTSSSPVQYIKRIRLDAARRMMAHEGHTASSAAYAVGYKSVPQFSREFKRLFGTSPAQEAESMRSRFSDAHV